MKMHQGIILAGLSLVIASCGGSDSGVSDEKLREEIESACEYSATDGADAFIDGSGYGLDIDRAKKSFTLSGSARIVGTGAATADMNSEPVRLTCSGTYEIIDGRVDVNAAGDFS